MTTSTHPALTSSTMRDLAPGQWALARSPSDDASYSLFMMTDSPCRNEGQLPYWVLHVGGGSAAFVSSAAIMGPIARLDGEVRFPLSILEHSPKHPGDYTPGLLYVSAYEDGLYLVAQVDRNRGAARVAVDGTGGLSDGLDRPDLWPTDRIEYRDPGDSDWAVLQRIDEPLE